MANAIIENDKIIITIPVERVVAGVKEELEEYLNNCPIEVIPIRKLSSEQNGLIHVLLKQYADELGWTLIDMKEYIKEQFALTNDLDYFSTAKENDNIVAETKIIKRGKQFVNAQCEIWNADKTRLIARGTSNLFKISN